MPLTDPELRITADPSSPGRMVAMRGDAPAATLDIVREGARARAVVALTEHLWTRDEARLLLRVVMDSADGARTITLEADDILLRHEARTAGLTGGLRQSLVAAVADLGDAARSPEPAEAWKRLGDVVGALLPGVSVTARPARGMARRATSGTAAMVDLAVVLPDGNPLLVSCPDVADVVPENLALAIDTVGRVRSRFPMAARAITSVSFDHSHHGLKAARYAGMADPNAARIHLNASLASAAGLVELGRSRRTTPPRPPAAVTAPATVIDGVTAHEAWHQVEAAYEARAYPATIEFRRSLGRHFGVATLEHAVLGGTRRASPEWRAANEQLVAEVSAYAGTTTREATAEMFKLWWCSTEPAWSPAVCCFDEAVRILTAA